MSVEFVDTNVLVYAYDRTAGARHVKARSLVARLWRERVGALSLQVLQEFYVNITRKITRPVPPSNARVRLRHLARWKVVAPTVDDLVAASELAEASRLSYWDALIIKAAQSAQAPTLWSEDLQDGQTFGPTRIRNPFVD
ncbi:MAG: PIN domain-containing protein [Candidatus Xenobia bacterium]